MSAKPQRGFSLLETMVALVILLAVGGIVMSSMVQLMKTQSTIANRTEMHTSVRSATELLQQEIGQAGKVSLAPPNVIVTMGPVVKNLTQSIVWTTPGVTPVVYPNEWLTVDVGNAQETVQVTGSVSSPTAFFTKDHVVPAGLTGVPVYSLGAFATGIVPPDAASVAAGCSNSVLPTGGNYPGITDGSTCSKLKLYGDINDDGNMVYIEYTCVQGTSANPGFLYRNQMPITQAVKPAVDASKILLTNVLSWPTANPVPCFAYQVRQIGPSAGVYGVTNVALTLTVQTQNIDPVTHNQQTETKALLNVGPRNIIEVWGTANLVDATRAQQMPASVAGLLHDSN
jgi:prepilin-type N-terminal cleavage/methylation domain-containing protein